MQTEDDYVNVRILITGAGGFVGQHLVTHLIASKDIELHGTFRNEKADPRIQCVQIDLRNETDVQTLISDIQPDYIYHLAGQAFVPRSFEAPWETFENNVLAQLNLFQACITTRLRPRFLVVSSAEIYGTVDKVPINEDAPLRPSSPYSVSKVTQDMLGLQYFLSHELPIMRVRAFNHIGPGQSDRFVAPAFATQIARIEAGLQEPVLRVGDLSDRRDFTDVRDIVRAYKMIIEQGIAGEVYNVASGQSYSIQELLDTLLGMTPIKIKVTVDESRLRPTKIPILEGDVTRLHRQTGWKPLITFEETMRNILEDCRKRVAENG